MVSPNIMKFWAGDGQQVEVECVRIDFTSYGNMEDTTVIQISPGRPSWDSSTVAFRWRSG